MSRFKTIDSQLITTLAQNARNAPRRRKNYNLHLSAEACCQRLLNAIEPDSYVQPHRHLAEGKSETIIVLSGRVGVLAFDETGRVSMSRILAPNSGTIGVDIPAQVFHSVVALEPGSVFFECKAGPYLPLSPEEKAPWAPGEGGKSVAEYLDFMLQHFKP